MDYNDNFDISSIEKESQNLDRHSSKTSESDSNAEKSFDREKITNIMIKKMSQV